VLLLGGAPIYAKFVEIFVGYQMAPLRVLLAMVAEMGLPLFLLGLGGAALLVWRRERRGLFLALATVIPLAALVAISPWVMVVSRYVFPVLPFWALLAGYAIWELGRAVPGQTALLVWVVLALVVSESLSRDLLYFTYQNGDRQDWKGAFAVVTARAAPDDAVYTTRTEIGAWYLARPIDWTEGLTPAAVIATGRRAWFVVDDRTGHLSPEMTAWLGADTRLVSVNDVTLPGKPMFLRVYLYDPRLPPLTP
jgi:hypothetical protein